MPTLGDWGLLCQAQTITGQGIINCVRKEKGVPPIKNNSNNIQETLITTGPGLFTTSVLQGINKDENRDIIFPNVYFCPFAGNFTIESFAFHDFWSPVKQQTEHWVQIVAQGK